MSEHARGLTRTIRNGSIIRDAAELLAWGFGFRIEAIRMKAPVARIGQIQMDGFFATTEQRGASIAVRLGGNADMAVQENLKAFLDELSMTAKATATREVVFDWSDLYFMNSSCLSLLLRFINGILELGEQHRYKLKFMANPHLKWQEKSLKALHSYAKEIVVLD
jgi:anti-anti-sigma factor